MRNLVVMHFVCHMCVCCVRPSVLSISMAVPDPVPLMSSGEMDRSRLWLVPLEKGQGKGQGQG